ncbi:MAG TPA: helix-turn-helix domain-containing protein [Candidatus Omnitrophota bacterium]|nr:helix-turn-helix domain-containing protein [Candidatus Omnitrophota bacterium]
MKLTVNDIVKIFAVPERTVHDWIEKKNMPFTRANEQVRFNYIALLDWAMENKIKLTPEILAL